jgi:hypothetical protein
MQRSPEDEWRRESLHAFPEHPSIAYLERLIPLLRHRGLSAQIESWSPGPPVLHVVNTARREWAGNLLADCSVTIDMDVSSDVHPVETWFYWWDWAERIGPAADLSGVIAKVAAYLRVDEADGPDEER